MKKLFLLAVVMVLSTNVLKAGDKVEYKPEELKDAAVVAKKYVKANLKLLKKLNIKKLVILECTGEFVTSKEVTDGAFRGRADYFGNVTQRTRTTTLKFDKDYYTNITDAVYESVVDLFEQNGIEIIRKETVIESPTYKEWNLKEEKEGRGVTAGMFKDTTVTKTQKVSTTGLGIFPGPIKMIGVVGDLGPITAELGAEGFLQVHFRVDKTKKFAPALTAFEMLLSTDLRSQKVGFKGKEKLRYDFYTQWQNILNLEKAIESKSNLDSKDPKDFDKQKYNTELTDMLYGVIGGFDVGLKNALPENKPIVREAPAQVMEEAAPAPAEPTPAETK
ncbi:MAG: hypothetical protein A2252_02830 [Elusimicrobia bacterium RIFOXYA2_FULL_39_19]|nr:MAG: hypothetical protein A2252_02830 [Elusimicrobia bacterium RIFOXYA2_FULL_39_19]